MSKKGNKGNTVFDPARECMTSAARNKYYLERVQVQAKYSYEHSPAMKAKFDKAGVKPADILSLHDLEHIPITHKDDLIDMRSADPPWGGLLGIEAKKIPKIFMSPGPIYDPMPAKEDDEFFLRIQKALYTAGFREGDIAVNTWAYHMVPAGHWYEEGLRRLGVTVIPMGTGNTDLQVRVLQDMKATGWLGSSSFFMNILEYAEKSGLDPRKDFSLRVLYAGGEMGGGPMRKLFQEKYGFPSFDAYGTADSGIIAYECGQKTGMHIAEELFVEIVDPATGRQLGQDEIGEVVVTPFIKTYPLFRFGTGDLSSFTNTVCPCGRTSLRLPRIMGRSGDAVRVRGMFVHPRQTDEVISRFKEVAGYQFIVTRPASRDEMILRVELKEELADREDWEKRIKSAIQDTCKVKCDMIETVRPGIIATGAKKVLDKRKY